MSGGWSLINSARSLTKTKILVCPEERFCAVYVLALFSVMRLDN